MVWRQGTGWGLEHPCGGRTELGVGWQRGTLGTAVSPGQAVLGVTMSEVVEIKPKIKSVAFYIAGPEHHERPRLTHKNETSVAGEVWAYPGPVLTAGKVTPSPPQVLSIRGFISEAPAGLC